MSRLTIVFLLISLFSFGQEKKGNVLSSTADAAKMALAKQKLYAQQYTSALNMYREIERDNPNDAIVKYYVALCYFNLGQHGNAKETVLKAAELDKNAKPEIHLLLGKLYHLEENFDAAIAAFTQFKTYEIATRESQEDADHLLSQAQVAKQLVAQPLDVQITNAGHALNSKYDDKNPCVTADGRKIVFTTRRPEGTSAPIDIEGDGKYFEDIYMASLDSAGKEFASAASVGKSINDEAHDACTSISPDGSQIFIYKNDLSTKEARGGNVFVSKISNGKWRRPEPIGPPINSGPNWEGGACVSPDGKRYFFTSERKGGFGKSDIWMVDKKNKKEWGEAVNLGPEINTAFDEAGMFLAPDGKTLFFCSDGPKSMGSYDIFKTVYENGKWSTPVNVGFPINSISKEGQLTLSADARTAFISSDRKGGLGESDIYKIDLKDYAILEKEGRRTGPGPSIVRGTIRESFEGYGLPDVQVTMKDESGTVVGSMSTDENGEYFFTTKAGNYNLEISKSGYQTIQENIVVGSNEKETVIVEKGYLLKK
jgi:hypothetical protein